MKNAMLFAAILFSFMLQAQETLNFKIRYQENTWYSHEVETSNNISIRYEGDPAVLEMLEEQGVKNPTVSKSSSKMDVELKTGKLEDDMIPLVMELDMGDKVPGFQGKMKMLGKTTEEGPAQLESITAPGLNDDFKATFLPLMQSMLSQVKMPDATLKTGESFTQSMPMSIPVGPINMKMNIDIIYVLKKIKGDKAYFDIKYNFTTEFESEEITVDNQGTGSGSGSGSLEFDIKESFTTAMETKITMKMAYTIEMTTINLEMDTTQKTRAVIKHL